MSTGLETVELIDPWIYSTLNGDVELLTLVGDRIYGPVTPDEIEDLYVTTALLSNRDIRGVGMARIQTDAIYVVKAVAASYSFDAVAEAAGRINALLDGVDTNYGAGHITCVRETVVAYPEVVSGQAYVHLGGQYRIRANNQ